MEIKVLWCTTDDPDTNVKGQVGHPFPDTDTDRQTFTQTQTVKVPTGDSYGQRTYTEQQQVTQVITFCGYHWEKKNPFQSDKAETPALTKSLEVPTDNDAYDEGWRDAEAHYKK